MELSKKVKAIPEDSDVILIIPPFLILTQPLLGVHLLQAYAARHNYRVKIIYGNIIFASLTGIHEYNSFLTDRALNRCYGEMLFYSPAYGKENNPVIDINSIPSTELFLTSSKSKKLGNVPLMVQYDSPGELPDIKTFSSHADKWVEDIAACIITSSCKIIGCSVFFGQINASIALFKRIKQERSDIITVMGGQRCNGHTAEGIASLDPEQKIIDYIFSGRSESTFTDFIKNFYNGILPGKRIIRQKSNIDINKEPLCDFSDYFKQLDLFLPYFRLINRHISLPYQSSTDCWWGVHNRCTFCGGEDFNEYQYKSSAKVVRDIKKLSKKYNASYIFMCDYAMPHQYFNSLIPEMKHDDHMGVFYYQRVIASFRKIVDLKKAGITFIDAGIESLSTELLTLMNKGTKASDNIKFLRYARSAGLCTVWNLLWGIPGDSCKSYEQMLSIIPLLYHLQPPGRVGHVWITRGSAYHKKPEKYSLKKLKASSIYHYIYPGYADIDNLASVFEAEYECGSHVDTNLVQRLIKMCADWHTLWYNKKPSIELKILKKGKTYCINDTRNPEKTIIKKISEHEVMLLLQQKKYTGTAEEEWALKNKFAVIIDARFVPLATVCPELFSKYEKYEKYEK